MNGNNARYTILTWNGVSDLRTLSPAKVRAQILDLTLQSKPLDLLPPKLQRRISQDGLRYFEGGYRPENIEARVPYYLCHTLYGVVPWLQLSAARCAQAHPSSSSRLFREPSCQYCPSVLPTNHERRPPNLQPAGFPCQRLPEIHGRPRHPPAGGIL